MSKLHFESRLVPLDKAFPKTPFTEEYRPIIITSPVIKCLEAFVQPDLQRYGETRMNRNQVGFVSKRSTADNIIRLNLETKQHKKDGFLVFIDFSSAYDSLNREKLYKLLRDRQILSESKI